MRQKKSFAVIGLGRFGASVAKTLSSLGYQVLAIDRDEEKVNKLRDFVTEAVQADTTDAATLAALGIRNFDAVVVAIGEDIQANIMTTVLLNNLGVPNIIAKAQNDLHAKLLEKIGVTRVVHPEWEMGQRIAYSLVSENVMDYIDLAPNIRVAEIAVSKDMAGQSLAQADLRTRFGINVMAIQRGNDLKVTPNPDERLECGDLLIAMCEEQKQSSVL